MTAIEEILEKLREEIKFINEDDSREDKYYQTGLKLAFNIVKEYLVKERVQIQKAYSQGRSDEETRFPYATDEVDYYNSTFGDSNEAGI